MCDTREPGPERYFTFETHFAVVVAKAELVNNAPILQEIPLLRMKEDDGICISIAPKFAFCLRVYHPVETVPLSKYSSSLLVIVDNVLLL